MLRIDEGLLDKNWRPSQKTVVETKVSLREKVAELNRKVGKPALLLHGSSFANSRKIQIISMEKSMGTMHFDSSVQLRFTTRYLYQVVPEAAVRGVRDAFPCCLVQRLFAINITIAI